MTAQRRATLQQHPAYAWGLMFLGLIAASGVGFGLDHRISLTSQAMLYVLVVVVVAYAFAWQQSIVCAVLSVVLLNFFFVPPRWTLAVENHEHLIALGALLCVALVISHLASKSRRETQLAQLHAQRAGQLQALATELSNLVLESEILTAGQQALDQTFEGPNTLVLSLAQGSLDLPHDVPTSVADGLVCCLREIAVLGPGTGRWPGLNAWYVPMIDKTQSIGAACVQPALAHDMAGREHAHALCALVGQAVSRLRLRQAMQAAQSQAQRQQLQSTYLAAISHDLRTPLAAVMGAATSLQTQGDKLSAAEQQRLLGCIISEASYLCTLTENTLQLVQWINASQEIELDWESIEEIVGAVLARVRQRDSTRRIKSSVTQGIALIKASPVLLAQLIENLLDNALKYSTELIDLVVNVEHGALQVSVKDRGPTIPLEQRHHLFEPYVRGDQSGQQRGIGLGLALCRFIAKAHDGTLTLRARSGGGNVFTLTLPMPEKRAQP